MKNVMEIVKKDLFRHSAKVKLPGESNVRQLYLIMVGAKTNTFSEYCFVFKGKLSSLHEKIAKKILGDEEKDNVYGIFVDEDTKMIFAFNCLFADYNREKKEVIYKDPDDIVLNKDKKIELLVHDRNQNFLKETRPSSGRMLLKYSLLKIPKR